MARPKKGARLGSGPAHQKLMLSNLASDLFRHGQIRTTEAKAKALRPYAEKLITKAKQGDLHARRQVISKLRDRDVVAYLFEDVAPRFVDRNGGYTRILKLDPRPGDNARMALIQLTELGTESGDEVIEEGKKRRSRGLFGRRRKTKKQQPQTPSGLGGAYDLDDVPDDEPEDLVDEAPEEVADDLVEEALEDADDEVAKEMGDAVEDVVEDDKAADASDADDAEDADEASAADPEVSDDADEADASDEDDNEDK